MAEQQTWTIQRMLDWTIGYLTRKGDSGRASRRSGCWGPSRGSRACRYIPASTGRFRRRSSSACTTRWCAAARAPRCSTSRARCPSATSSCAARKACSSRGPRRRSWWTRRSRAWTRRACGRGRVLEVGIGTGCIACSIASERRGTHVVATDISERAASLAERNRDALGLDGAVDVVRCDLAAGVDPQYMGAFDVLVSNPPSIPQTWCPRSPRRSRRTSRTWRSTAGRTGSTCSAGCWGLRRGRSARAACSAWSCSRPTSTRPRTSAASRAAGPRSRCARTSRAGRACWWPCGRATLRRA